MTLSATSSLRTSERRLRRGRVLALVSVALLGLMIGCRSAHGPSTDAGAPIDGGELSPYVLPAPTSFTPEMRARLPGTVDVVFVVAGDGSVRDARAQASSDPVFETPALDVVRGWDFGPGARGADAVPYRVRISIRFVDA